MCKLTAHSNSYICNFPLVNSKSEGDLKFGHLGLVSMLHVTFGACFGFIASLDEVQRVCDMWQLVVVLFIFIFYF